MRATVIVTLREGVLDPQGKAVRHGLQALGHAGVRDVRVGKFFEVELDDDVADPQAEVEAMCAKLLANTVIEDYRVVVEG